ncbi:MAG: C25 family cysteine peptidase [candidate division WOR-3 bacterium]
MDYPKSSYFKIILILLIGVVYFLINNTLFGNELIDKVRFDIRHLRVEKEREFDKLIFSDCGHYEEISNPMMPAKIIQYLIPPDAEVIAYKVLLPETIELAGNYTILPTQPPQPISFPKLPFAEPNPVIYESNAPYPENLIKLMHTGSMGGFKIATFALYPLQYYPKDKRLKFYPSFEISISYERGKTSFPERTEKQISVFQSLIGSIVKNSDKINFWMPAVKVINKSTGFLLPDSFEYVIITDSFQFGQALQPLVFWKTKKGIRTRLVDKTIANSYPGRDFPEKLRNFIRDATENWGTIYFLLAGDYDIVPHRNCYLRGYTQPPFDWYDTIPADLYFSDLDGTWDYNNNNVFGEYTDRVDGLPDVFVGRVCISSVKNCSTFVNKLLKYEKGEFQGQNLKLRKLFLPADLEQEAADSIANLAPDYFFKAKCYPAPNGQGMVDSINSGYHLIFELAHGSPLQIGGFNNSHFASLNNQDIFPIYVAQSCLPGRFDCEKYRPEWQDCFAESIMNCTNGGALSCVMNSTFGRQGSYFHFLDLFYSIFNHSFGLGVNLAYAKGKYIPLWDKYALNLLGDPEMIVWLDTLKILNVTYPCSVRMNSQSDIPITVKSGNIPIENALVTIYKPNVIYSRKLTDGLGMVSFPLPEILDTIPIHLTVTKRNYKPYEAVIRFYEDNSIYLTYRTHTIYDSLGNNNGILNPGETVEIKITVANIGDYDAFGVSSLLRTPDFYITMIDSCYDFGTIPAGDSAEGIFAFSLSPLSPVNRYIHFSLLFNYNGFCACTTYFNIPLLPISPIDIGVVSVLQPHGTVPMGWWYIQCIVKNFGRNFVYKYKVKFQVNTMACSTNAYFLGGGDSAVISLGSLSLPEGNYSYQCYTVSNGDNNFTNDSCCGDFTIKSPGWYKLPVEIPLLPDNKNIKSGGCMVKTDNKIYIVKGNNTKSFYFWIPESVSTYIDTIPVKKGLKKGCALTYDSGDYLYLCVGSNTKKFLRYNLNTSEWQEIETLPTKKGIKGGASIAFSNGNLYLLRGTNTTEFWRYDTTLRKWDSLARAPTIKKPEKGYTDGSCLIYYDNSIYALRGKYNEFYKYDIENDTWYQKESMPLGSRKKKVGEGAGMTIKDNKIYALKGNNTGECWIYDLSTETWSASPLEEIPKGSEKKYVKGGSGICAFDDFIYIVKGNNTRVIYRYWWPEYQTKLLDVKCDKNDITQTGISPTVIKSLLISNLKTNLTRQQFNNTLQFRVYDVLGKIIYSGELKNNDFDFSRLPAGVYFIQMTDRTARNPKRIIQKIIVTK